MATPAPRALNGARTPRRKTAAPRRRETAPVLCHISSSRRGGWPLFCRLLLWATRNAGDGAGRLPN
ncbi:MAG: hypothetical protein JO276_11090 [Sphingomonadaceae bacterium]|nr:hypothetical protein [Sphingomonadaceae bacterium]